MHGGVDREYVGMDGFEPFYESLGLCTGQSKHGTAVCRIPEEKPVDSHSLVVGHKVVPVAGLGEKNVVREDGVRFAFAFEHERTACAEAQFDTSFVHVLSELHLMRILFIS